ncbi:MAG: relaxase/mobilization nuclease domain-containing protein [Gemmatimonadaceae bacterium]|jgi:hypothetical protein|nr:relaxase/mobilization nuclease domain-containing protein [Gemmatimonadaceae bacterium]
MIAVSSSGTGFKALATYLVHGRTGLEAGRVAWTSARNLPTAEPALAATLMRATAAQNVRVEKPVYHLALAFDPRDPVDRATMERVADRVLGRLGLDGHQVLIAAHQDRAHPHLHILVNRVHPETGRVWDRWQDMPAIQAVLRDEEHALGLRAVPGHLHVREVDVGAERGTQSAVTRAPIASAVVVREAAGDTPPGVLARARAALPAVRTATTWEAVELVLGEAGLRLERRGSGLVVTDGEGYAKASSVAPDLTLRRLEARLGAKPAAAPLEGTRARAQTVLEVPVPPFASAIPTPDAAPLAAIARDVAQWEQARALGAATREATDAVHAARAALATLDRAIDRAERTQRAVGAAFGAVYADPAWAQVAFEAAARAQGVKVALGRLGSQPEAYGALRAVERPRAFGFGSTRDESAARQGARVAQGVASEWIAAGRGVAALIGPSRDALPGVTLPSIDAPGSARRERVMALDLARTAERAATARHRSTPSATAIEQGLREAVRRLTPTELQQLQAMLTRPQIALVQRVRQAVRDMVLGRDGAE